MAQATGMSVTYDVDFHAWALAQADALSRRSANELDWENLREEIEGLGKTQRKELRSRLGILIAHLLKWEVQPDLRGRSWYATIRVQRRDIARHLSENPSLRATLEDDYREACEDAVLIAALETSRPESDLLRVMPPDFETAMTLPIELEPR